MECPALPARPVLRRLRREKLVGSKPRGAGLPRQSWMINIAVLETRPLRD